MGQNLSTCTPLLSMSDTILFRAIFLNGRHKNLIWTIYPAHTVLYSVQCIILVHPSTNGTALYSVQCGMLVHPCTDGTALYSVQCGMLVHPCKDDSTVLYSVQCGILPHPVTYGTVLYSVCVWGGGGDGCHLRVVPPGQLHRRPSTPKRFINIVFFSRYHI